MSPLRLNGSTSGYSQIDAPAVAGDQTFTLHTAGGTLVTADGTQTLTNKTIQGGSITSGTSVASTSGTAIDFTGIPSWVKRITVMFDGVSTNGTSDYLLQLGDSGGIETTGYLSMAAASNVAGTGLGSVVSTAGVLINYLPAAADVSSGLVTFATMGSNIWIASGTVYDSAGTAYLYHFSGSKTLSDTLTQLRITTVNGTDTFDAGTINILYEG